MKYELAKKLKDAGFPQKHGPVEVRCLCTEDEKRELNEKHPSISVNAIHTPDSKCFVYLPTLSELIEACGERFKNLHRHNKNYKVSKGQWSARYFKSMSFYRANFGITHGHTPEEAVANLWLELNKK